MKTLDHVVRARTQHHAALARLYQHTTGGETTTGLGLWRKLRRIEREANAVACAYCNGEIDMEQWEAKKELITAAVKRVFGGYLPKGFFLNGDPRGYSLKLEAGSSPQPLHEDWGRYQILAPEINS